MHNTIAIGSEYDRLMEEQKGAMLDRSHIGFPDSTFEWSYFKKLNSNHPKAEKEVLGVKDELQKVRMPHSLWPYHMDDILREHDMSESFDDEPEKVFWEEQKVLGKDRWHLIDDNYMRVVMKCNQETAFLPRWTIEKESGVLKDQYRKYFPQFLPK